MSFKILKSPRMERVLAVLQQYATPSTKEIEDRAGVCAARDYVRRLRDKGYLIERIEEGTNENGARVVRWKLHRGVDAPSGDLFGTDAKPTGVTYRE